MKRKKELLVVLFFIGLSGLFFYPVFLKGRLPFPGELLVSYYAPWSSYSFAGFVPGSVPNKAQGIDVVRQLFPWKIFSIDLLKKLQIPLWNPFNFAGNPHLANFQTGIFYPLSFIFLLFPLNLAWTIFIVLQPFLACLFTYLFMREIKVSRVGSVFASLAFAYGLYFTVWLEWGNIDHAILWLPLAIFLIEKIVKKLEIKWILLLIFSLTSSILAGYIQVTIYLFAVVFAYFFFRLFSSEKQKNKFPQIAAVLGAGVVSLLLCSAQLLPTWEIFQQSARGAYSPEKISELLLPWFHLIVSFVPDFFGNPASRNYWLSGTYIERVSYIGVLPLFFAFLAIFYRRKEKNTLFFLSLAAAILVLTLNLPPARLFYKIKIPFLATTVPTRILYLFAFSMSVLAGFGVDFYFKNKKVRKITNIVFLFLGLYLFFWLLTFLAPNIFPGRQWLGYLHVSKRNLILPTAFSLLGTALIVFSTWRKNQKIIFWGVILLTLFDLFFYFRKITPFSPKEFVYPETEVIQVLKQKAGLARFWGYGSGNIDSNFATILGIYSTDGYDPLFIQRYGGLISASENGQIKEPIPRSDVALAKGFGKEALRQNLFRQRLLNLLGVKYVLQKDGEMGTFPLEIYQEIWQKNGWQIYENKQVLPRAFLASDYVVGQGQAIVNQLMATDFDLKKTLILEEPLPTENELGDQTDSQVEITSYQPNQVMIKTKSQNSGLLFLSDNFYPGWEVKVDGQPTKIYRADYSFRAVLVPAGDHQMVFSYQPDSFRRGIVLSLVSLACIILIWRKKITFGLV